MATINTAEKIVNRLDIAYKMAKMDYNVISGTKEKEAYLMGRKDAMKLAFDMANSIYKESHKKTQSRKNGGNKRV